MPNERILILGGTRDARELAGGLISRGFGVITSLAGVTGNPVLPPGEVRTGGFGGVPGLASFLAAERITAVVDATHPFAMQMSRHAHEACSEARLPLYRLERPVWRPSEGDHWINVLSAAEAAAALPPGARAMVTIGRKEIAPFFARQDVSGLARMIEDCTIEAPVGWTVLRARPPFSLGSEMRLMADHGITHLVTKNAGGADTEAKLIAARQSGILVVMIQRQAKPSAIAFATTAALIAALCKLHCP